MKMELIEGSETWLLEVRRRVITQKKTYYIGSKYFHFKTTFRTAQRRRHSTVSTRLHAGEQKNILKVLYSWVRAS